MFWQVYWCSMWVGFVARIKINPYYSNKKWNKKIEFINEENQPCVFSLFSQDIKETKFTKWILYFFNCIRLRMFLYNNYFWNIVNYGLIYQMFNVLDFCCWFFLPIKIWERRKTSWKNHIVKGLCLISFCHHCYKAIS